MGLASRLRVWLLVLALAASAAVVWLLALPAGRLSAPDGPVDGRGVALWLGLTLAFVVTDMNMVHVNVGRQAHSFSFSFVPLVVGLFEVGPTSLVSSRALGAACALTLLRRQPMKVAFNVAQTSLGVVLASTLWAQVGDNDTGSMRSWLAAVAALLVVSLVSSLAVSAVIRLAGGRQSARAMASTLLLDLITAVTQTAFALLALAVVRVNWLGLWAIGLVAAYLVFAQRSHVLLQKRHGALQRLNDVAGRLSRDLHSDLIANEIVVGAVQALDGAVAELELIDDGESQRIRYDGEQVTRDAAEDEHNGGDITVPLTAHGRLLGHLRVSGSSAVRAYGDDEKQLLHALAQHASTALTNGKLADKLRRQVSDNEHQATHDSLTQLPNRLMFERITDQMLTGGRPLAVLLLDLDRFKDVNDTLGHGTGDRLLQGVAERLVASVRAGDTVARLGGDEFVVVAEGVSEGVDQGALAARVQDVLDAAMYRAKARGRGRYELSHESPVGVLGRT